MSISTPQQNARRARATLYRRYEQASLKSIYTDVKRHDPGADIPSAWVWRFRPGHWEFHYKTFYWHGQADSALEARAAGWTAWLSKEGAEGYEAGETNLAAK